eukprot:TRINITY_DN67749_c0_g1_i1.p1 TRINITY_DN67749_c0_g1~~TRINITY_DN67749_c0_g1_i1.p1  ORF type:complete len:611 (+),score=82.86 TRINITY_DN67749_c0_g1_i1:25-1857(+)
MPPQSAPRTLVLLAGCLSFIASEELNFISSVPDDMTVYWLPGGELSDAGSTATGSVRASRNGALSQSAVSTTTGHAFRIQAGRVRSAVVVHSGGPYHLVAVSKASDGSLDLESIGSDELQSLVLSLLRSCGISDNSLDCARGQARAPLSGMNIPGDLMDKYLAAYSPFNWIPVATATPPGARPGSYGSAEPPDEMIVVNSLASALSLRCALLADNWRTGDVLPIADGKTIGTVDAKSVLHVTARPGQVFFLHHSDSKLGKSRSFVYPGEMVVVGVREPTLPTLLTDGARELLTEVVDQDTLKLALSDAASACSETSHDEKAWGACFADKAAFPASHLPIRPDLSSQWFKLLWGSLDHWRQCVYNTDTVPVRRLQLTLRDAQANEHTIEARVLREEPLVLTVPAFASPGECSQFIDSQGLRNSHELSMAFVSGGGRSKARRTLSKNIIVDPHDTESVLRRLYERFFEVARRATGYELQPEGQEPVNWLYYKPGYEYRPHCDGGCGSQQVQLGERVASSLLYCSVADKGGATIFTRDNLKLTPSVGDLLLFAYKSDPKSLSQHAACPVLKGNKSTATQWYREGVSNDWNWEQALRGSRPPRQARTAKASDEL